MLRRATEIGVVCLLIAATALAEPRKAMLPATADVGLTSVRAKQTYSNGLGPSTPIMQNQNWSGFENKNLLMAFDTKAIKGWTVSKASMHVFMARGDLYGVGLCTVLSPWEEGGALNGVEVEGAPCWSYRSTPAPGAEPKPEDYWSWPGSKFYSVSWAHPSALYSHAGPGQIRRKKTKDGRFLELIFPVDPALVESLAAGVAYGLVLTDDKGQVGESYSLIGPAYPYRYNPAAEAWVFTKDIHEKAYRPVLEVHGEPTDKTPPGAPTGLKVAGVDAAGGEAVLEFTAPGDDGAEGTVLAYEVRYAGADGGEGLLPRWSVPKPVAAGQTQRLPVFTLPAGAYELSVCGVDEAGNRGPSAAVAVTIPPKPEAKLADAEEFFPAGDKWDPGDTGSLTVSAVGDQVKVDPVTGAVLTDERGYQPRPEYLAKNPVWSAETGQVYLHAAANEVVAFQLILKKARPRLRNVRVSVSDLAGEAGGKIDAGRNVKLFRLWYVSTDPSSTARPSTWYGDACLPLAKPFDESFDLPAADNNVPAQEVQSVWVDVYVPRGTPAGDYSGKVTVSAEELTSPVTAELRLRVLPLSLPDKYTYTMELNRYHNVVGWAGVDARKDPAQALRTTWDYYRLAHEHRCVLNALPYSHSGRVDGDYRPEMEGEGTDIRVKDWTDFDRRFGPLLDGSAFTAEAGYVGPGAKVPIHHMYLPYHENWPVRVTPETYEDFMDVSDRLEFAEYAKKSRRPDVAFTPAYKAAMIRVARQFAEHFQAKGWTGTSFHFFNNNKYYWKVAYFGGMGRGGASFWLMDEPTDFDDYDANAFVLRLARRGVEAAEAPDVKFDYRTDVSQPEMTRTLWDNVCTVWCLGGWQRYATTAKARRRWLDEETWTYGGGTRTGSAPVALSAGGLMRWSMGVTGWMPWWDTFRGKGGAWRKAGPMAVYYCGHKYGGGNRSYPGPIAGVRMKDLRRAQQDIEYLNLLAGAKGWSRSRVRLALAEYCDDPEAPVWSFSKLSLEKMNELRGRVISTLLSNPPR